MIRRPFWIVWLVLLLAILPACGDDDDNESDSGEREPDRVTLQLKWTHNPQFAGFYVAERQGYYDEENLDVNFLPGGPGIEVIEPVRTGEAQFGVASGDAVVQRIAQGSPFLIIGATYQQNPFAYAHVVTDESPSIEGTADDWRGLRIANFQDQIIIFGILDSIGLSVEEVELVQDADFSLTAFVEGETDLRGMFLTNEVSVLRAQGYEVDVFLPEDFGVLAYQDVVVFNTEETSPDLVRRFMRASLRGWEYAVENPADAIEAVSRFVPSQDIEDIEAVWNATLPLVNDGGPLLRLEDAVFESMVALMIQQGLIDSAPTMSDLYTTEYLSQ